MRRIACSTRFLRGARATAAVRGQAHAQLPAGGQDLRLDSAREQRVLDLQVGDRMDGVGAAHRFGSCLRQADVPHIARTDHLCDGSDGLLDWYVWVYPAEAVGVDVIGAEASQG